MTGDRNLNPGRMMLVVAAFAGVILMLAAAAAAGVRENALRQTATRDEARVAAQSVLQTAADSAMAATDPTLRHGVRVSAAGLRRCADDEVCVRVRGVRPAPGGDIAFLRVTVPCRESGCTSGTYELTAQMRPGQRVRLHDIVPS